MKSALLTKAALCICPPAVVATTVATVPAARHAVHRLTAAYEPRHIARKSKLPPCEPLREHKTFASDIPTAGDDGIIDLNDQAVAFSAIAPSGTAFPGLPQLGPSLLNPNAGLVNTGPDAGPPASGVPEPSAWLTMTIGFGMIGGGLRQRRRQSMRNATLAGGLGQMDGSGRIVGGSFAAGTTAMMAIGSPLGAARVAQMGSKSLHSAFLAKAAMCVCPPVAMALGTAAIPLVRHAVFNATAPQSPTKSLRHAVNAGTRPCLPTDQLTAAESVGAAPGQLAMLPPTVNWPGNAASTGGF